MENGNKAAQIVTVLFCSSLLAVLATTMKVLNCPRAISTTRELHSIHRTYCYGWNLIRAFKGNNGISINREEFGPGVYVADFDVMAGRTFYLVNGSALDHGGISVRNPLYHNNGDGTFTEFISQ